MKGDPDFLTLCADPEWRIRHLYFVIDKEGREVPFAPWPEQLKLLDRLWNRNIILKARQRGFCLEPSTRVLTADLRWVPISEIGVGQEVIAVDEDVLGGKGPSRKMRTAVVQATKATRQDAYRITFDDGRSVICSGEHRWLSKNVGPEADWRSIKHSNKKKLRVGTSVRWITKPWCEPSVEDGWFGGMLDGEGCLANGNRSGGQINVCQRRGPVWFRLIRYVQGAGFNYRIEDDGAVRPSKFGRGSVPKICVSRLDQIFRLIGQTRPTRFLGKRFWEGKGLPGYRSGIGWSKIVSIEPLGPRKLIDLQTSTGTFIAEGFVSHNSTLIQLVMLDTCLFNPNVAGAVIAQDKDKAAAIFRTKFKFAYDRLPEPIKAGNKLLKDSETTLHLANGSTVEVTASARSGTLQWLHVSEFGKICAKYPEKAREIVSGSLPAVDQNGVICIESTAEGQDGAFHDMCQRAQAIADTGKELSRLEYRFHFASWWDADEYETEPSGIVISRADNAYFYRLEGELGIEIGPRKRAWYVAKRDNDFSGEQETMWREYPSTPTEAFQQSLDGVYLADQLAKARVEGRITTVPYDPSLPVNTFWDLHHGGSDDVSIWFHQRVGLRDHWIRFLENSGEPYGWYVREMQSMGYVFGKHYLPHDAGRRFPGAESNPTVQDILNALGLRNTVIVARVADLTAGINQLRDHFPAYWIDEVNCADGIKHLGLYRKEWNDRLGCWRETPREDGHQHAADALRQHAQGYTPPSSATSTKWRKRNRSGMAV